MPPSQTRIEPVEDAAELAQRAARWIADLAGASRGRFAICLSGGSTPRRLYRLAGRRALSRARCRGTGCTGSGATSASCPGTIRTAITAWRAKRCSTHVPVAGARTSTASRRAAIRRRRRMPMSGCSNPITAPRPSTRSARCLISSCSVWARTAIPPRCFRARRSLGERQRWVAEVVGAKPEVRGSP